MDKIREPLTEAWELQAVWHTMERACLGKKRVLKYGQRGRKEKVSGENLGGGSAFSEQVPDLRRPAEICKVPVRRSAGISGVSVGSYF